jgi:hypothetical protein
MNGDAVYWATNVSPLDDATLLRFIDAVEARRNRYEVALTAAVTEATKRRLIANKKGPAMTPGQSREET